MKNLRIISLLSLILIGVTNTKAQSFEGKIEFSIEYIKIPDMLEGYESMLPSETFYYVKGNMLRTEVPMAMGGDQVVIFDKKSYSGYMLMNMLGTKMAVEMTKEDLKAADDPTVTQEISYYDEKKEIAGYTCKKAIITVTYGDGTSEENEVWYTEDIPNSTQNFDGLKGMALSYTVSQNDVVSQINATNVKYQKVDDSLFDVPEGYEHMTMQELEEMGK